MADTGTLSPLYDDDKQFSQHGSIEKKLDDIDVTIDDEQKLKEVEEFKERIDNDEATEDEYRVEEAYEVAIKVLSTRDDPELPSITFRSVLLGLGFSAFGAVLAQIYYFKPQTLSVSRLLLLILTYWFGSGMHLFLPSRGTFKYLNPGPFNIKEHVAILIMSSTAATSATAIQVISVQMLYYDNNMNAGIAIFTLISSQLIGYGFAGVLQDVLVYPSKCFWPANIYIANLLQALHYDKQMTSKRVRLFWVLFAIMFCWEIVPEWIFPLLTGVSIFCLADNNSVAFRNIFGGASNNEGMGLLAVCFDWNYVTSSSMWLPLMYQLNMDIGVCLTYILMATVYYGNLWKAQSFPWMSQALFNSTGSQYNQTALLTNGKFDPVKYAELGPAYYSVTYALSLITSNLSLAAMVTHVGLYHWDDLKPFILSLNPWNRQSFAIHDAHHEKMKAYKQIPRWWYVFVLLAAYGMAQATNYTGRSQLPWWLLTVILIIGFLFTVLSATLSATIGFSITPTGFFEMITGYMRPGYAGVSFLQDLKLGVYAKLPPRSTFAMQISGTIVGALLNYVMMLSIINAQRPALLSISGTRLWSGQNAQAYNSNAISWGALGSEMFGSSGTYHMVPIALAIGLFLPVPFYIAHRIWPKAGFQHINTSIILGYSDYLYVGINTQVNTSMAVGIFSQWWVRKHYPRWFTKYNYIVAAALDGGTQVIMFILNFALFGAAGTAHPFPEWWGNDYSLSADRCVFPNQ
ncbi:OPT oligopeptide transporter [Sparassis crispa]|uniref:OPT oligopeptide transporter n=1 Tax=Sparassis crispa TaxID=139825 RepID=A0A401GNN0_9APHY|nr:OPT oligopeptide transporter [Sparassis crispa]GBE83823.1 OPT oligopeptide transporter [Sparassis crispa]